MLAGMVRAYIAMGSNLGKRQTALRAGASRLGRIPHSKLLTVATFRETAPHDAPPGSRAFINSAAALETELSALDLLAHLHRIERELGRDRSLSDVKNGPRTLDLDLLLYGQDVIDSTALTVPHPRMHLRRFVLEPLAEIAPEIIHPILGLTIGQLVAELTAEAPP